MTWPTAAEGLGGGFLAVVRRAGEGGTAAARREWRADSRPGQRGWQTGRRGCSRPPRPRRPRGGGGCHGGRRQPRGCCAQLVQRGRGEGGGLHEAFQVLSAAAFGVDNADFIMIGSKIIADGSGRDIVEASRTRKC